MNLTPQQRKTALLFQSYMLFPNLTVAENVAAGIERDVPRGDAMPSWSRSSSASAWRASTSATRRSSPAANSSAWRSARMLAARPGILMLDEPFSALDAHLKGVLEQNLVSLFDAYDGTMLYVSHDIDEALRFCDRIAVVEAGRIMETGTGDDLVNRPQSLGGREAVGLQERHAGRADGRAPREAAEVGHRGGDRPRRCARTCTHLGVRAFYLSARRRPRRELLPGARRPRERLALRPHGASGLPRSCPGRGAHRERTTRTR